MAVAPPISERTIAAGYRLGSTVVTTTPGVCKDPRHFVMVAAGILCRTELRGLWEVVLYATGAAHPVYLGHVESVPGGWDAIDGNGQAVAEIRGVFADYLDAEAALIANGSTEPAACAYEWPLHMLRERLGDPVDCWDLVEPHGE